MIAVSRGIFFLKVSPVVEFYIFTFETYEMLPWANEELQIFFFFLGLVAKKGFNGAGWSPNTNRMKKSSRF